MQQTVKASYMDYNTYKRIIEELIKEYPFLNAEISARTSSGRGIFSLSLGNTENCVLYVAGMHGSQNMTSLILLLFVESLCRSVKFNRLLCSIDMRKALTNLGVTFIPCLNPDGTEIFLKGFRGAGNTGGLNLSFDAATHTQWKANAMGVDINRNFGTLWHSFRQQAEEKGISSPAGSLFTGEYPESEAETKALTRLCRIKPFRQSLCLFQGDREIFYRCDEKEPEQSAMMAKILACSEGYSLSEKHSLWGFQDWFINEFSRPSFTLTVGKNCRLLPEELQEAYEGIEEALTLFALM